MGTFETLIYVLIASAILELILIILFIRMAHDVNVMKEFIVNGKKPIDTSEPEKFEAIATGKAVDEDDDDESWREEQRRVIRENEKK